MSATIRHAVRRTGVSLNVMPGRGQDSGSLFDPGAAHGSTIRGVGRDQNRRNSVIEYVLLPNPVRELNEPANDFTLRIRQVFSSREFDSDMPELRPSHMEIDQISKIRQVFRLRRHVVLWLHRPMLGQWAPATRVRKT